MSSWTIVCSWLLSASPQILMFENAQQDQTSYWMWHATLASSPAIASARLSIFCIKAVSLSLSWCTRSSGLRCGRIIYKFQSKELVLFSDSSFGLLRHSEIAAIIHYFSVIGFLRLTSHNENVSFTSAMFYQAIRDAKRIVWLSKCLESEEQV